MGGKHWTNEQIEILKNEYGKVSTRKLAEKLNKTKYAVNLKANRISGLCFPPVIINNQRSCCICKIIKTVSEFHKSHCVSGYKSVCKSCAKLKSKIYRNNPQNKKRESKYKREELKKIKEIVYNAYGGYICKCCGETNKSFLSIDHINNNGNKMRQNIHGIGMTFYRWLKNSNYPKEFQILCMNCQFGRKLNNGICPHQEQKCIQVTNNSDINRPIWQYTNGRDICLA